VGDVAFGTPPSHPASPRFGAQASFTPLPGTADEIRTITEAWTASRARGSPTVLRGAAATEAALRREVTHARYLHLATHGFFIPESPRRAPSPTMAMAAWPAPGLGAASEMLTLTPTLPVGLRSGLAFANANRPDDAGSAVERPGDDGLFTALELAGADLSGVDLVVLSACETGLGRVAGGEGVLGLQRAFQVAGARTVVASLWKVNDGATQALMAAFYSNLWNDRLPRIEALRRAQIAMLNGTLGPPNQLKRGVGGFASASPTPSNPLVPGARLHPAYWAGFVLSGDWR
jgi:CHAT domain-containing protein